MFKWLASFLKKVFSFLSSDKAKNAAWKAAEIARDVLPIVAALSGTGWIPANVMAVINMMMSKYITPISVEILNGSTPAEQVKKYAAEAVSKYIMIKYNVPESIANLARELAVTDVKNSPEAYNLPGANTITI